jgi:hypothetical protein
VNIEADNRDAGLYWGEQGENVAPLFSQSPPMNPKPLDYPLLYPVKDPIVYAD